MKSKKDVYGKVFSYAMGTLTICMTGLCIFMLHYTFTDPMYRCTEYTEYKVQVNDVQVIPNKTTYRTEKVCIQYFNDKSLWELRKDKK